MARRAGLRGVLRSTLVVVAAVMAMTAVGPCPEELGPLEQFDSFESIVYGQVTLAGGDPAVGGLPVYVTPRVNGCTGAELAIYSGDSTATDAQGRYNIHLGTFREMLPAGSGQQPSFCAEVRSAAPGSTDTVRVNRELTFRVGPTDSTRVDLVVP